MRLLNDAAASGILLSAALLCVTGIRANAAERRDWRDPGVQETGAVERALAAVKPEFLQELLDDGLGIDQRLPVRKSTMMTPLALAISRMASAGAVFLIEEGADIDRLSVIRVAEGGRLSREIRWVDELDYFTPLMHAADVIYPAGARLLIEHGADVNARGMCGVTALMLAAHRGNVDTVKMLLEAGAEVDGRIDDCSELGYLRNRVTPGADALWLAARGGSKEIVRLLVEAGADPQVKAVRKVSPTGGPSYETSTAVEIAEQSGHPQISAIILGPEEESEAEAPDVDWRREMEEGGYNIYGLLEGIVARGDARMLQACLDDGLDVDAYLTQHEMQRTLLLMAAEQGSPEVIRLLIKEGADVDLMSRFKDWGGTSYNGAPPGAGWVSPLMKAAEKGCLDCLTLLLEADADVHAASPMGDTAMAAAARRGDVKMLKALLAAGADIDPVIEESARIKDGLVDGATPLWFAAREGRAEAVRFLLDAGAAADVVAPCQEMRDAEDCTPRDIAERRKKHEVLRVFEELGAEK